MEITFKFSVLEMTVMPQRNDQENVVRAITWQCVAERDGLTGPSSSSSLRRDQSGQRLIKGHCDGSPS